jgi:hypothetical protein
MSNYHDEIWRIVNTISFDPAGTHTGHREIEDLLERALADQREAIFEALKAERDEYYEGPYELGYVNGLTTAARIARTFGQTGEGDDD